MVKKKLYILKKEILISDILRDCPKAAVHLTEHGLLCIDCPLNQFETLEKGAQAHQMTEKQIEKMIKEINKKLEKG